MAEGDIIKGASAKKIREGAAAALARAEAAGEEVTGAAKDTERALRQQRDALRKEAEVAKEEATEARKRATKAEGRLKGARTKARNLRETPFVAHADRDAHAEKLRKAEAAIERAEGPAEQAKAAQKAAHEHAQQLDERSRAATRAVFDFRSAEQAKTEVVKQEQAKQTAAVKQGTEQRRRFEARAIVDEKGRPIGGKRGGAIGSSPLHEIIDLETGRRAQGTGEYTRAENARRRAADLSKAAERAAEETAEVVEKTEDRQTTAVEKGTAKRKKARAEEGKAIGGNTAEFSRKVSEHADLLASELTPEQRVEVAKQIQKTQPAQQARAAKKLTEAVERQVTAPADENERLRQAVAEEIRATQTHAAAKREADAISRQADKLAPEEIARRRESLAASNARLASAKADLTAAEAELVAKRELAAAERLAARQISASGLAHQQVPPYLRARQSLQPVTTPLPWWMDARVRAAQESQLRRRLLTEGVSHTARGTLSPDEVARRRELRESGGIGRYPPPPPPPPRPPAPPGPPEPPEPPRRPPIIYNEELAARAAEGQATYASRVRDSETALRRWSAQLGIADQSMRKHGTFTTEFIDAARKGDVAYREWGWQIGAAAAKFGAWTAAGAGIYAAISAVQKVGQGALDSASGVPMLRRTIPGADSGQAQRQFRQLSTDFAVPISDAADAMMRMGAVFKTQEGAFIGARTALMAYRTGEVDVATATQQLTQIQTGMGASAQDLADIFDRLNYVQNNYGARIPDLLDGTSKLSAAWRQAGGDADYLVAIITAMNRTAGASGAQAATILGRTIGNIAKPSSAGTLRRYGITPDQTDIMSTIDQAIKVAQRPGTTGPQVQEIAKALAGGSYYQRQWVAILQDPKIFQKLLGEERQGKYKGASQQELDQVMKSWSMRLAEIGSQLANLGSNLAQGGFLNFLGAGVVLLTTMLKTVNGLLEAYNRLPGPIKTMVAGMLTIVALLRLARRFGLGGAFAGRLGGVGDRVAPFLNESAGRTARRSVSKGLNDAVKQFSTDYEDTTRRARSAAAAHRRTLRSEDIEVGEANRRMRLPAGHPDYYHPDEGNQRIVAAQARTARSLERSAESNLDAVASTEQLRQARKELAQFEKEQASAGRKDRNRRALEFGRRYGLFGPPSLPREYPESEHVRRMMGMSRGGLPLFEAGGTARMRVQADELQREVQRSFAQTGGGLSARYRLSPGLAQTIAAGRVGVGAAGADRARRLNLSGALNVAGAIIGPSPRSANENVNQLRRGMRLQTSLAAAQIAYGQATTRTVDATRRALTQVGPKIASARIGMRNLASQFVGLIDPAGLLLTAILSLPAVFLAIKGALDQDSKRFEDLSRSPKTAEDKQKLMQELSQESTRGTTFGEYLTELTTHDNPITNIKALFGIGENELTKMRQNAAKGLLDAEKKLAAAQKRARARGQDVPELTAEEIDKDVNQSVARYQSGRATIDAAIASVQKALRELEKTSKLDDTEKADKKEDLLNQLSQLNKEKQDAIEQEIEAQNQALDSLVQSGGATSGQLRGYIAKQVGLVNQFRGDTSAEGMQKYAEARQNLLNTLKESGQQDLDARLSNAMGDPKKIDQAYRSYEKQFRDAYRTAQGATQRRGGSGSGFVGGLRNDIGFTQTRAAETVDPKLRAQLRQIRNEREQAVFEARRAIAEARTEVATGNAPAGEPRLQLQLRAIGTLVRGAIRVYGRRAKETLALIAQQQQAEAALVEYQGESITSRSELAASRTTDPVAQARINIGGLQELLAYQRGNRKEYDANAIRSTQTQINNAEQALAETIRQQSTDLLNAHYALLESRNDDPVYQARLEAKRTAEILSRGGFQTPAERMQAAAESNNARRAAQDAAVRAQIENIDFDVEIGKKTTEQQIAAYEKLLKNSKMGQQQKKELQRQIARLKHEAETSDQTSFELGLGNIRIPTMYEVARLVKGGPGGVTTAVNNANTVNVTVNGPQDYEELGRVLDRHVQGTGKSMARAAQMR